MAEGRHDVDPVGGGGAVPLDGAGAEELAAQLERLAADWEAAFGRRRLAAEQAREGWSGPLAHEFEAQLAAESDRSRQLVELLRAEAQAWSRVGVEASGGTP